MGHTSSFKLFWSDSVIAQSLKLILISDHKSSALLVTGTEFDPAEVVAELKTIPQILSTHTEGVPVWVVGLLLFVAHGIVIQSVDRMTRLFLEIIEFFLVKMWKNCGNDQN